MKGKCAKQTTIAIIWTKDNEFFVSTNWCNNPQEKCPRNNMPSGTGYKLCRDICGSRHAEVNACELAGYKANGGTLYLIGHTYICKKCREKMNKSGIINYHICKIVKSQAL